MANQDDGTLQRPKVSTVDFASEPATAVLNGPPQTTEEWDRYALGDLGSYSFTVSSPKNLHDVAPKPDPFIEPIADGGSGVDLHDTTSSSDTSGNEPLMVHTKVSSSGPANQDPDIPNIAAENLSGRTQSPKTCSPTENDKPDKGRGQEMSMENMNKLRQEQCRESISGKTLHAGSRKGKEKKRDKVMLREGEKDGNSSSDDEAAQPPRRKPPRRPRSRGSWVSKHAPSLSGSLARLDGFGSLEPSPFESGTNTSASISLTDMVMDHAAERVRVRDFFEKNGYLPAPRPNYKAMCCRMRVIRRLGLDRPETFHRNTLDRLTRLAQSFFKTQCAMISIITKTKQIFLSEIGFNGQPINFDESFCCHAIMTPKTSDQCFVVCDTVQDWRFRKNPLVDERRGAYRFYAGSPLRVGQGSKEVVIGVLSVLDDKPREFLPDQRTLLADLASCVVSELELLYSQQASIESAKLHKVSVDFLRRSLKHRPLERAGKSLQETVSSTGSGTSTIGSSILRDGTDHKRIQGADSQQFSETLDIYDEACQEIRVALNAYAVAVVDLSQFHLFYPAYQNSSTAGESTRAGSLNAQGNGDITNKTPPGESSVATARPSSSNSSSRSATEEGGEGGGYSWSSKYKNPRPTCPESDPLAPSRNPQVLFIPPGPQWVSKRTKEERNPNQDNLAVLGYSCEHEGFAFNFTQSAAAKKIIAEFIVNNVETRKVWYTRDDSEGIAQSINHLMPPGTETSLALPIFGFDGQVAFAVVACWIDPLYTYPAGAMQFVETIAGSLLASVLKEKLHQAERAQLHFASAASHELRTPLHQINAAANLLRSFLHPVLEPSELSHIESSVITPEDRIEILAQLEIIESNGISLGGILENIIDTLDIGKMALKIENPLGKSFNLDKANAIQPRNGNNVIQLTDVLEKVVDDAMELEAKTRRIAGLRGLVDVEVILEIIPRVRGGWLMCQDPGPIARALGKIIHNAVKFTEKGHVHITVQDISREFILPIGFDNSINVSTVSIDIKDTGRGMSADFLDSEVLRPFSKEDPFTSGSGLGLGLAQRMVELLGGKLAIASSVGKGTLVHVEVPLRLLNGDSNSDQDDLCQNDTTSDADNETLPVRQDGIYLAGWMDSKQSSIRRVGKCLTRQLKVHKCRVVSEINFASLIVIPEDTIGDTRLADLCQRARPNVQVIILERNQFKYEQRHSQSPVHTHAHTSQASISPTKAPQPIRHASDSASVKDQEYLSSIPIIRLPRPLRPSVLRRIMEPPPPPMREPEHYVLDVVGGDEARVEAKILRPPMSGTDSNIASSPLPFLEEHPSPTGSVTSQPVSQNSDTTTPLSNDDTTTTVCGPLKSQIKAEGLSTREPTVSSKMPFVSESSQDKFKREDNTTSGNNSQASSSAHDLNDESMKRPELKEAGSGFEQTIRPNSAVNGATLKVLVVEDNAINRKILTTMLRRASCQYAEASDGVEAVQQFASYEPHLVLLDITMPRKDGFTAAAEIRQLETKRPVLAGSLPTTPAEEMDELGDAIAALGVKNENPLPLTGFPIAKSGKKRARIIAVTALSAEQHKRKGLYECGIDHWLTKPLSMSLLRSMIEQLKQELREASEVASVE
ncbi:uncharacterized protein L203_100838 [Cryptococcus depauperatus CBS 7841]|uniref:histidine kinase n=1 Tax=Cryptococcus depauperatus CBS 7841 TaxID=1295531 RepID=A0AAJ8JNV6_9TREE